ncbi:MAG: hypothetical protein RBR43_04190 [Desulfuromonadaceae bacterium]|nr:hypothetical protein [Desulfuromonas sp.]MDY0185064.1 hypothetical protein [Desulfuromonadaceae bacterium]
MQTFEVHYQQNKKMEIELVEAESAESAWKEFVLRTKGEANGETKQVMCVIRHSID